jgi:hypothetical protein
MDPKTVHSNSGKGESELLGKVILGQSWHGGRIAENKKILGRKNFRACVWATD